MIGHVLFKDSTSNNFLVRIKGQVLSFIHYNPLFRRILTMIIIIDIIVLSIDNYPLSKKYTYIIETIDFTIFLLFCVELLLKSLSYGIKIYFKNPFNCLNFILILMNSIQYIYETTLVWDYYSFEAFALKTTPSAAFIKPAKAFRVFEVMYYSRFFASFSILFKAFIYSLTKMKFFLINTVFLILMLGLIGKELFAYKVRVESTHHWKLSDDLYFFFNIFFLIVFLVKQEINLL